MGDRQSKVKPQAKNEFVITCGMFRFVALIVAMIDKHWAVTYPCLTTLFNSRGYVKLNRRMVHVLANWLHTPSSDQPTRHKSPHLSGADHGMIKKLSAFTGPKCS